MKKQSVKTHLFRVMTLSLAVILLGGGTALLYQVYQGSTASHASSDSVVGLPSLPASYVDAVFRRLGSPMVGTGQAVEEASRAENIDDAFALAVWWTETNDGAAGVGLADRNPGSVRGSVGYPSAYDGYTIYPSYSAAVTYWFSMMKRVYIDRGLTTVSAISHPYVGTSTSNLWAGKVIALMQTYRSEAPPPPTPTPTVSTDLARHANEIAQRNALEPQTQAQFEAQNQPAPAPKQNVVHTIPAPTTGLSAGSRNILVLLDLLAALGLGLWAWSMYKRYAGEAGLAGLLADDVQEKLRTGVQRSAALFNSFASTGRLNNLASLAVNLPDTEGLKFTGSLLPLYSTEILPVPDARLSEERLTALIEASTELLPVVSTSLPVRSQFTPRLPGLGLPSFSSSPGQWSGMDVHSSRFATDLPPVAQAPVNIWDQLEPLAAGTETPLEPLADPWKQSQLVGAGSGRRSNGLLSRYREMQNQEGQEFWGS